MSIRKDTPLAVNVSELLEEAAESAREELSAAVEIVDVDHVPAPDEMFVDSRKWLRMRDVVVVVVDLKNSTKLTWDEAAKGSARVYEAVTGNVVRIIKPTETSAACAGCSANERPSPIAGLASSAASAPAPASTGAARERRLATTSRCSSSAWRARS